MYQTSTPVTGKGFHNRENELGFLSRSMRRLIDGHPQWVAILGPRKIGKTSLVLEAARRANSKNLQVVTLDVQEQGIVSLAVFRRLALAVVDAALGEELGESLERLANQPAAYRGLLLRSRGFSRFGSALRGEILELVEGEITPERIGRWLNIPEEMAAALGTHMVLALDEFQELDTLKGPKYFNPFALIRSHWQKHQRVAYFISGSARSMLLNLVESPKSPFFQHFALKELGPFEAEAAMELLQAEGKPDASITNNLAALAVQTIGGYPFYLQLLGEELLEHRGVADESAFKAALQRLLFSRTGRLALYFEGELQKLVGRSASLAAVLDALAEGPSTLTAIAKSIRATSGATVTYLDRLHDAVEKTGKGLYRLTDPTFALWLRWCRPGGTIVPMTVVGDEAEKAVARHLSAMGFDLVYQSKGSRGAFDLLATRGASQLGVQVKRSDLPLRFKKTEWARMVAEGERLEWLWIVVAVTTAGEIFVLDPGKASSRKEVTLTEKARIGNLLLWLDRR